MQLSELSQEEQDGITLYSARQILLRDLHNGDLSQEQAAGAEKAVAGILDVIGHSSEDAIAELIGKLDLPTDEDAAFVDMLRKYGIIVSNVRSAGGQRYFTYRGKQYQIASNLPAPQCLHYFSILDKEHDSKANDD